MSKPNILFYEYEDATKVYSHEVFNKFLEDMRYGEDINNKVYDIIKAVSEGRPGAKEATNLVDFIENVANDFGADIAQEKRDASRPRNRI